MTTSEALRTLFARLPWLAKLNVFALLAAAAALCVQLWPEWMNNPDLAHGRFMPLIFLVLLFESVRLGPVHFSAPSRLRTLLPVIFCLLCLATLCTAGLWAAALEWSHSLVNFSLSVSLSFLLAAALLVFSDARAPLIPLNWSSCAAIILWPLSAPIPPGTYSRITFELQILVSSAVVKTLHALGIAAHQTGNIIELARGTLGVDEACSGIRSLMSCLFAGIFLSATLVRRTRSRIALIVLAPLLAVGMNFLRSLILTLLTHRGIDIGKVWHDGTGIAVIGLTTLILAGLAFWLEHGAMARPESESCEAPAPSSGKRLPTSSHALTGSLMVVAALTVFFYSNTHRVKAPGAEIPDLQTLLPLPPEGWRAITSEGLQKYQNILLTDHLVHRVYLRGNNYSGTEISLYLAYWAPGQAPISAVSSHTPDACWPGSGWVGQPASPANTRISINGRPLPWVEARYFTQAGRHQYVWFWHLHNRKPIPFQDPYSIPELLKIAWRYGFERDGDQLFVRVTSNKPWSAIEKEVILNEFFARLERYGL